jgi:hypothetical protein
MARERHGAGAHAGVPEIAPSPCRPRAGRPVALVACSETQRAVARMALAKGEAQLVGLQGGIVHASPSSSANPSCPLQIDQSLALAFARESIYDELAVGSHAQRRIARAMIIAPMMTARPTGRAATAAPTAHNTSPTTSASSAPRNSSRTTPSLRLPFKERPVRSSEYADARGVAKPPWRTVRKVVVVPPRSCSLLPWLSKFRLRRASC